MTPQQKRELLELAAKAAGAEMTGMRGQEPLYGMPKDMPDGSTEYTQWNPIDSDGDALRLAVKLGLAVSPYPIYAKPKIAVVVNQKDIDHSRFEVFAKYGDDAAATTRLVIVKSAAEIGKAMT